jgi:hypothetical protein
MCETRTPVVERPQPILSTSVSTTGGDQRPPVFVRALERITAMRLPSI